MKKKNDYIKHPFSDEIIPKNITALAQFREDLKSLEKIIAKSVNETDEALTELLSLEGGERFQLPEGKEIKIVRSNKKIWDMKKVYDLVGENKTVKEIDMKTGEIKYIDLFTPVDKALKLFIAERKLGKEYSECYYHRPIKPFIKIETLQ